MADKTAILGGSFDPVHKGHIFLLHCAVTLSDYNHIIIVPAKLSNFKQETRPVASDFHRLEMLNLALEDYSKIYPDDRKVKIEISDMEIKRGGVSYTSDTVDELLKKQGCDKLGIIIGDDHIGALTAWHDFENLKKKVQFVICNRIGTDEVWDKLPDGLDFIRLKPDHTQEEDSTSVRKDVDKKLYYLSEGVADYVRKNNLYH